VEGDKPLIMAIQRKYEKTAYIQILLPESATTEVTIKTILLQDVTLCGLADMYERI
jgi:hypothetical protein